LCFLLPFWYIFLIIVGSLFWFRFLSPPGCILGPKNAPRGCKTTPPSTQNCSKTMCFFVFFAHRLFRRFDASLCLLGPLLVPTLPLQGRFWHPFWTQNRIKKRLPEKALGNQRKPGLLRLPSEGSGLPSGRPRPATSRLISIASSSFVPHFVLGHLRKGQGSLREGHGLQPRDLNL
jgi:hypothetical protein